MSAPMIAWVPALHNAYKYITSGRSSTQSINLPSVQVHDIETAPEKRPRTLKHLIKANHINHAVLYNNLRFHNHLPHHLGSAYLLGADVNQLHKVYDEESKDLDEWVDSPAEITDADWRNFWGDKRYQRAYVDFFEDGLALKMDYDWKKVVDEYLYSGKEPLVNGIVSGLGHPLIHLGYAAEFSSREIAMEALSLAATCYSSIHKYLDNPSYTKPSTFSSTSPLEILNKIHSDTRFDNLFDGHHPGNFDAVFSEHEELLLEYWNAWTIKDPVTQFRESQETAAQLLVQTVVPGSPTYDFYLVHLLTTSHAIRILLPSVPAPFQISLVRQWFLFTCAVYIAQLRPHISQEFTPPKSGTTWKYEEDLAVSGPWSTDAHFVKGIRALREAAFTWGDVHERYLGMATRFADEFGGWTGFGSAEFDSVGGHY